MREPVAAPAEAAATACGLQPGGPYGLVGHGGSMPGFLAGLDVAVEEGLAVVAFANATSGPDLGALVEDLVDVVAKAEPRDPAPWAPLPGAEPDAARADRSLVLGRRPVRGQAAGRASPRAGHARLARPGVAVPTRAGRALDRAGRLLPGRDADGRPRRVRRGDPPRPGLLRAHPRAVRAHGGRARAWIPTAGGAAGAEHAVVGSTRRFSDARPASCPSGARFRERASENRRLSRRAAAAAGSSRRGRGGRGARGR